jgi:hypothetical protein
MTDKPCLHPYDLETYKRLFTFTIYDTRINQLHVFEISARKDNRKEIFEYLDYLKNNNDSMVGFNNLAFDYPVLHYLINNRNATCEDLHEESQNIINSMKDDRFGKSIPKEDMYVRQIDLYKIHHFDNQAKRTSLKIIKFNMRRSNLIDFPLEVDAELSDQDMEVIIEYNIDDVLATYDFLKQSESAIKLREELSIRYETDFTNFSDSKIGSEIFIKELENEKKGTCFNYFGGRRVPRQTKRSKIEFYDIVLPYVKFNRPEFQAILDWIKSQTITETKGVFTNIPEHKLGDVAKYTNLVTKKSKKMNYIPSSKEIDEFKKEYPLGWVENRTTEQKYSKKDGKPLKAPEPNYYFCWKEAPKLSVIINGHEYVFGTGGLHSSIDSQIIRSDENMLICDWDVESYYPNLSIKNNIYPKHLGMSFCKIYNNLFNERKKYDKKDPNNLAIKLALNGTYGNSNNEYSPFYDPKYTMKITLNGQLSLCMLIERILNVPGSMSIQSNTDGITMGIKPENSELVNGIVKQWEEETKLKMERNDYAEMRIRDVNNYTCKYLNSDKIKLKGTYVYDLENHKNHSALIVKKAVATHIATGQSIEEIIKNHKDEYDFMLRTKIPKTMTLVLVGEDGKETVQQRVTRYYVSKSSEAKEMVKIMPPKEGSEEIRRSGICVGKKVKVCNNIKDFAWDVDYDYYCEQANKLLDVFNPNTEDE